MGSRYWRRSVWDISYIIFGFGLRKKSIPVIDESHMTLIDLIDKVRMLDNDLIRLEVKLTMLLQHAESIKRRTNNAEVDVITDDDYTDPSSGGDSPPI